MVHVTETNTINSSHIPQSLLDAFQNIHICINNPGICAISVHHWYNQTGIPVPPEIVSYLHTVGNESDVRMDIDDS